MLDRRRAANTDREDTMRRVLLPIAVGVAVALLALSWALAGEPASRVLVPTEVAVASGVVADGQEIPLPVYADGTQALEEECRWIVSVNKLECIYAGGEFQKIECYTGTPTPRSVTVRLTIHTNYVFAGTANFMIIATRTESPVAASRRSWGAVKDIFR
jgi:hypothetical protein